MAKCDYGRWAIINKEGHEFGNLGWFTNSDKADVLAYCKERDIKIQEGEERTLLEKTKKFEGHLTPLRKVEKELSIEVIEDIVGIKAVVRRHEDTMNKDMAYTYKTALDVLYGILKTEGYSESHLNKVIYSETFEHKGIKY
jgi:hypothetical protein